MNKPVKCFIVEGVSREYRFIKEMAGTFFKGKYDSIVINLPAEQNIYMLYEKMKKENYDIDLIELLREEVPTANEILGDVKRQCIDEVFLFFDFDIHQNNLPANQDPFDALKQMIAFFDNETENGKLYISYPMVEALYDYNDGFCEPFTGCLYSLDKINEYKTRVGTGNSHANSHFNKYEEWRMIISIFGLRVKCLLKADKIDYQFYSKFVTVQSIFERQKNMINRYESVFILSAFPEFLLDYFRCEFWAKNVNRHKYKYKNCPKKSILDF